MSTLRFNYNHNHLANGEYTNETCKHKHKVRLSHLLSEALKISLVSFTNEVAAIFLLISFDHSTVAVYKLEFEFVIALARLARAYAYGFNKTETEYPSASNKDNLRTRHSINSVYSEFL